MLQQAVETFLRGQGWTVESEGHMLSAAKDESELVLGFVEPGEAPTFADFCAESSASLAAILMQGASDADAVHLEESGIACFPHEEIEDLVLANWLDSKKVRSSTFVQFLNEI